MRAHAPGGAFPPLALALVGLSWAALLVWDASPFGRYLNHGGWSAAGGALCQALPHGSIVVPALLYVSGWLVMSAAMMLPTSLPLVRLFDRMIANGPNRNELHAILLAGYLAAWGGFGLVAHGLDTALLSLLGGSTWLITHSWAPGAVALVIAGGFQFSRLKYVCLDACRSPLAFLMSHWRGPHPKREAFALGIAHGLYCVGCCWALMLLMFVVGAANLSWMFALALVMAIEKNHAWGRKLAKPLGAVLLAAALATAFRGGALV
jgi:predicted metal-binding membrane protein